MILFTNLNEEKSRIYKICKNPKKGGNTILYINFHESNDKVNVNYSVEKMFQTIIILKD